MLQNELAHLFARPSLTGIPTRRSYITVILGVRRCTQLLRYRFALWLLTVNLIAHVLALAFKHNVNHLLFFTMSVFPFATKPVIDASMV